MGEYRLTPLAENDLEEIWLYSFKHWSATQADSYVNEIMTVMGLLASGQLQGRSVDIRAQYLKYQTGRHLIFFRKLGPEIEIIRILHQSMDFQRHI